MSAPVNRRSRVMRVGRLSASARAAAVVGTLVLLLSACTDDSDESAGAAEPAEAPTLSTDPAGSVIDLAPDPEGIVFDPVTGTLAVAVRDPNRLLLLEGATGRVRAEVPLPGHARHLQLAAAGGPVLVPTEDSNMLLSVRLPEGQATEIEVGEYPHDAAQTQSGRLVVGNEMDGTLSVAEQGSVVYTFDDLAQPGGLAASGDLVGVIDVAAFTLSVYDIATEERIGRMEAGEGPTHIVADGRGNVMVADTRGDALLTFSLDPIQLLSTVPLPGKPYGLAFDATRSRLWVTLTATNELVGFDISAGEPSEVARYPTVRQPNSVAVDPGTGRVFVAGRESGELQTIQS